MDCDCLLVMLVMECVLERKDIYIKNFPDFSNFKSRFYNLSLNSLQSSILLFPHANPLS